MRWSALIAAILLVGCARPLPVPLTAGELARHRDGEALVAYLGQPDASAAVCDLGAAGPHLPALDAEATGALVRGLVEGRVPPPIWKECVAHLVRTSDREGAAALLDALAEAYPAMVGQADVELTALWRQRLAAAHQALVDRPAGVAPHAPDVAKLRARLRRTLDGHPGPVSRRYQEDLLALLDLEQGMWRGRPVTPALLEVLGRAGDERDLRLCAARLPDEGLRLDARRWVIRLHIQASPFPEVRDDPAAVEDALFASGSNALSMRDHPPRRAWIETDALPARSVLVRQDVIGRRATLLGAAARRAGASVFPAVPLRAALRVEVDSLSRPVTLCGPPEELDPSPCLRPAEVAVNSRFVLLDHGGLLRFRDDLSAGDLVELAHAPRLAVPIAVAGTAMARLDWELRFELRGDAVFPAAGGQDDFHLRVRLERGGLDRLIYAVTEQGQPHVAVVEGAQAAAFRVISRGAPGGSGMEGSTGTDGSPGTPGSDASCPSSSGSDGGHGGEGSPGGVGGPGGSGGDGGNIRVEVACQRGGCDQLLAIARQSIVSLGGPGGVGGRGGRGGSGGPGGIGGSGAICSGAEGSVTGLSGGMPGVPGFDGTPGADGAPGSDGAPGHVELWIVD